MTGPVLVCCDVGPDQGVGHLMRCLALAEELLGRGHRVTFAADAASVPWARELLRVRGIGVVGPLTSPGAPAEVVARLGATVVVVDSYTMPEAVRHALRAAAPVLVAVVDAPGGDWAADVEVDQNLGGPTGCEREGRTVRLRGPAYALLRDDVRRARVADRDRPDHGDRAPRVLLFLGGTDPAGVTPLVAERLLATGRPLEVTVVAPDAAGERAVLDLAPGPGQRVDVVAPTNRLPALAVAADLVVCAAGTSLLELLHLGVAAAVLRVADNQARGYDSLTATGAVVGLGSIGDLHGRAGLEDPENPENVVRVLTRLLDDAAWRSRLCAAGPALVDGRGRERVADAALEAVRALQDPGVRHRVDRVEVGPRG
ncbi:MAG: Spore coat polysaccharide biosynthesis protein predicted glycosyltransferase-like protein [Marmoricola sp.]|nr:Spore coat polysaccharide biosynthesis protein predicted glycosyltransferase-like protein [Marmoricola sp.]